MMINPSKVLKSVLADTKWYFSVLISATAFGLFFLQTGIDLYRTGQKGFFYVLIMLLIGLLYGAVIIPLVSLIIWIVLKISKVQMTINQSISIICSKLQRCSYLWYLRSFLFVSSRVEYLVDFWCNGSLMGAWTNDVYPATSYSWQARSEYNLCPPSLAQPFYFHGYLLERGEPMSDELKLSGAKRWLARLCFILIGISSFANPLEFS
jgi:hypothetical protein